MVIRSVWCDRPNGLVSASNLEGRVRHLLPNGRAKGGRLMVGRGQCGSYHSQLARLLLYRWQQKRETLLGMEARVSTILVSNSPPPLSANRAAVPAAAVSWNTPSGSLGTFATNSGISIKSLSVASKGGGAITYSIASGKLPPGLALNPATGVISGTTTATVNIGFTVRASSAGGGLADRAFSLNITPGKIAAPVKASAPVTGATLIAAQSAVTSAPKLQDPINLVVYDNIQLQLGTGAAAGSKSFSASGLPAGLSISSSGLITGTVMAQENRTYKATVGFMDGQGQYVTKSININVLAHHYPG